MTSSSDVRYRVFRTNRLRMVEYEQCIEVGSSGVRLLVVHPGSGAASDRGTDRGMEITAHPSLEELADRLSRCLDSTPSR